MTARKPHCMVGHRPVQQSAGAMPDAVGTVTVCADCGFRLSAVTHSARYGPSLAEVLPGLIRPMPISGGRPRRKHLSDRLHA